MIREPSSNHWELLRKLDGSVMSVEEFLQRWELNKTQLANILGCDRATVRRFIKGGCRLSKKYQQRLALVNHLWSKI